MTSTGRPRTWPNGSSAAWSTPSRIRPTAIFSAAITAPTAAAATPAAMPAALVRRRHVAIAAPVCTVGCDLRSRCYSTVTSWDLPGKPRDDLVGDRAERLGPLLGRRLAAVAVAEQHDFVPDLGRAGAEIKDDVVLVDGPGDLDSPPSGEHEPGRIGSLTRDALVVAEREQPERRGGRCSVPV